jgi:hypothetical protein
MGRRKCASTDRLGGDSDRELFWLVVSPALPKRLFEISDRSQVAYRETRLAPVPFNGLRKIGPIFPAGGPLAGTRWGRSCPTRADEHAANEAARFRSLFDPDRPPDRSFERLGSSAHRRR